VLFCRETMQVRAHCILFVALLSCGCRQESQRVPVSAATDSATQYLDELDARIAPPPGWKQDIRQDQTARGHRVWVSPSGKTAYGVIRFSLPLPVGYEPVLWVFMREMRRSEGEATLLERRWDPNHKLLRFVAQGGLYTMRTNLIVRGFNGWVVYAGTLTAYPVMDSELALAERARELTLVGKAAGAFAAE
jgi:hypothetical protein